MLDEETTRFGPPMKKRDALLVLVSHSHEHLGQLIAYGRSNDVVPPWSQPLPEGPAPDDGGRQLLPRFADSVATQRG